MAGVVAGRGLLAVCPDERWCARSTRHRGRQSGVVCPVGFLSCWASSRCVVDSCSFSNELISLARISSYYCGLLLSSLLCHWLVGRAGMRDFLKVVPLAGDRFLWGPLLNRKSDLSVRNGVLLYKKLIRPLMDYACPAWRSAARSNVRKLHALQSKCLRLATGAPWYVSNRQIH